MFAQGTNAYEGFLDRRPPGIDHWIIYRQSNYFLTQGPLPWIMNGMPGLTLVKDFITQDHLFQNQGL